MGTLDQQSTARIVIPAEAESRFPSTFLDSGSHPLRGFGRNDVINI